MKHRWRLNKPRLIIFGQKTALSLLVIIAIFLAGRAVFDKGSEQIKKTVPTVSSTRNLAENHALSISSLFMLDGRDPAAYYNIDQSIGYIDSSYKDLRNDLKQNKTADNLNRQTLEQLLSQEPNLINQFKAEYTQLGKLLQYQPPEDIAGLDSDTPKAKERINTTVRAFQTQREQSLLTDQTRLQIDAFVACHKKTYELIEQNDISAAKENSTMCTKAYRKVRSNTIADLIETKNSTTIHKLSDNLNDLLKP